MYSPVPIMILKFKLKNRNSIISYGSFIIFIFHKVVMTDAHHDSTAKAVNSTLYGCMCVIYARAYKCII